MTSTTMAALPIVEAIEGMSAVHVLGMLVLTQKTRRVLTLSDNVAGHIISE